MAAYTNVKVNVTTDCDRCGILDKISKDGYTSICPVCKGTKRMYVTLNLSDLQSLIADGYVPSSGG